MADLRVEDVTLEERANILEVAFLKTMLRDGFKLKGSTQHELLDDAKKAGVDPEKAILIYKQLVLKAVEIIFKKKQQGN